MTVVVSSMAASTVFIVILFLGSSDFREKNDFVRRFDPNVLYATDTLFLFYNSYYIAGCTAHNVYLGNHTAALHALVLNLNGLDDSTHIRINVEGIEDYKFWSLKLTVDSPYFFLADGSVPVIFGGRNDNWRARRHMYDSAFFADAVPIGIRSFVIRSVSSVTEEYELGKESDWDEHIALYPELLQKQVDGRFCVDGRMIASARDNRFVYLYYYRNQFIVTDTSLNLLYRGKTIDTVSRAKITVADIHSAQTRTINSPPLIVNKRGSIYKNWLFVNSALIANNETREIFLNASVIDVYNLETGKYHFSFYIKDLEREKMQDFVVTADKLVVLYDKYIMVYTLSTDSFI
jgi:hypothetical protein